MDDIFKPPPQLKLIHRFRKGVKVVGMVEMEGHLFIATEHGIYVKAGLDGRLKMVKTNKGE